MFVFKVEGTGVLPVSDIILTALEILHRKILVLRDSLESLDGLGGDMGGRGDII